ncbi:MAG: hypothetical protein H6704_31445 [Myxococcales bacterium]|nr:hypothetical protein [Planctomycetota bacterium]MCB9540759.1 hypothetical protein [Myxococcales bacterium]
MIDDDLLSAMTPVVEALEKLGVDVQVGGSVASSVLGVPRTTLDADLVADLGFEHVERLAQMLDADYYADADMMREAVRRRSSFNLVHYATAWKIDVFVLKRTPFGQASFRRRANVAIVPGGRPFSMSTAEDIILHKLTWYRAGGEVSERQWRDVVGVVEVHGEALDLDYLRRWAANLGVRDLLDRALRT